MNVPASAREFFISYLHFRGIFCDKSPAAPDGRWVVSILDWRGVVRAQSIMHKAYSANSNANAIHIVFFGNIGSC